MNDQNEGGGVVSVNLDWKTGIAARDWESVARKEKIEVSSVRFIIFSLIGLTYKYKKRRG